MVTAASTSISEAEWDAPCSTKANVMEKHSAWAAAINSSGLVPFSFSKRVRNKRLLPCGSYDVSLLFAVLKM
jgi:hypothetical protein